MSRPGRPDSNMAVFSLPFSRPFSLLAGARAGLDRIGLLVAVDGDPVVLVPLRVAARDGERGPGDLERVEPGEQVVGVQAGGVESDVEVDAAMPGDEVEQPLAELRILGGRLDDFEVRGGGLEVGVEEGGVVAVAGRVDADADGDDGRVGRPLVSGRRAW